MFKVMDPESPETTQASYALNGEVMLCSTILLFLIILIIALLHTYGHLCFGRGHHHHLHPRHFSRPRPVGTSSSSTSTATPFDKGLHPSVLKFLPTFTYSSATHRQLLHDCSICLTEFEEDDEGRILPNCNHAFHCHCIDTWFRSHSSCPLCRAPVEAPQGTPPSASSNVVSERGADPMEVGCSSFPAPNGCPTKPLELVGIIVELPEGKIRGGIEGDRVGVGSNPVPGDHGL